MSKSLIRLVDEAILPAFLIIGLKVVAIAFINSFLNLSYYYQNFGRIYYSHTLDAVMVNTLSDFLVYIGMLLVVMFLIIRLLYFTDDKTPHSLILKLAKANKIRFIQTSVELYHIIFVWMVFFTGLTIYIVVRALGYIDYPVLILPVLVIYLTICWMFLKEVEKDIVKKLNNGKNNLV